MVFFCYTDMATTSNVYQLFWKLRTPLTFSLRE